MKTLLVKFYRSLACRVAFALVATASVANAHDFPQHFPLAPTDWGMIQQDCIGYCDVDKLANDSIGSSVLNVEFAVALPDVGNPPAPQEVDNSDEALLHDLIGPALYDGVDCAKLESYNRNAPADQLVEYKPTVPAQICETQTLTIEPTFEFHKSFFAACSCDFENRQANQSIAPPKFVLKRTYIEDVFVSEFNSHRPLVLRDFNRSPFVETSIEPLAIAIPTIQVQNKHLLADALSQLASFDCVARSEFYSSHRAFQLGEYASYLTKTWIADTLPSTSHIIAEFAKRLKPAKKSVASAPMFVIYPTAAGNEVAIPISHALNWIQPATEAVTVDKAVVSPEFKNLVDSANARLQWAGGRLSAAATYMNDWFSDRLAGAKSTDLR